MGKHGNIPVNGKLRAFVELHRSFTGSSNVRVIVIVVIGLILETVWNAIVSNLISAVVVIISKESPLLYLFFGRIRVKETIGIFDCV